VSAAARYVSMVEGGTWFDCSDDSKRNVDVCSAWDPWGRPLGGGDFRLECEGRAATKSELSPTTALSSDGRIYMIYLNGKDGAQSRTLVPVTRDGKGDCPYRVTVSHPEVPSGTASAPRGGRSRAAVPLR